MIALLAAERCDRCGAQAYVKVQLTTAPTSTLLFCGHHFAEHEKPILEAQPFIISDERGMLTR